MINHVIQKETRIVVLEKNGQNYIISPLNYPKIVCQFLHEKSSKKAWLFDEYRMISHVTLFPFCILKLPFRIEIGMSKRRMRFQKSKKN